MKLVRVALAVPLFRAFDYQIDDNIHCPIGARVRVPFGRGNTAKIANQRIGVIIDTPDSSDIDHNKLKPVIAVLDDAPILPEQLLALAQWLSSYYHYPLGEVLLAMLPKKLRQGDTLLSDTTLNPPSIFWQLLSIADERDNKTLSETTTIRKNATKQLQAYALLQQNGSMSETALKQHGVAKVTLQKLADYGLIASVAMTNTLDNPSSKPNKKSAALTLNTEQQHALSRISDTLGSYHGFLLNGITGSGKTEVYLQVIEKVILSGQQALVMVPEIGLTPQTIARFSSRFNAHIVTLHSGLNDTERLRNWQHIAQGNAHIVIGTRSAVLAPFAKLGVIIVDEEHDTSLKQQSALRYHGRDVALYRGQQHNCPVILGSATPSFESLQLATRGKLSELTLTQRAGNAKHAQMKIIDIRGHYLTAGLCDQSLAAIKHTLAKQEQVLVFRNRRGYSPALLCDACGWKADCPRCDVSLTLHQTPYRYLKCHHCDWQQQPPQHCPDCHSDNIKPVGYGTEQLDEALTAAFPDHPVIRIDRDTTRRKDSWESIYEQIQANPAAILVGTQMLAKGHHFPNVTLVVMPNIDAGLLSSDFRAPERIAQITMQVAGRAGRGEKAGTVLLQTRQPDNPLLTDLVSNGYDTFAKTELACRQKLSLPPYRYAALVTAESTAQQKNMHCLSSALLSLPQTHENNVSIWGPVAAPMEKKASRYRAQVVLQSSRRSDLHSVIDTWWQQVQNLSESRYIKLTLDIDPVEW